tara:strand:+ start:957 stop:1661 length:705 start_codon:yes stop_codon:yes gene_type:complete
MNFKISAVYFLIFFSQLSLSSINYDKTPWTFDDSSVYPPCFQTVALSGDDYEAVSDFYKLNEDYSNFYNNPGLFFENPVSLYPKKPIIPSWCDLDVYASDSTCKNGLKLHKTYPSCNNLPKDFKIYDDGSYIEIYLENSFSDGEISYSGFENYYLQKKISVETCQKLAPNVRGKCLDSYFLVKDENRGGSFTARYFYIFGIFNLTDKKKGSYEVLPLKQFDSFEEGIEFLSRTN